MILLNRKSNLLLAVTILLVAINNQFVHSLPVNSTLVTKDGLASTQSTLGGLRPENIRAGGNNSSQHKQSVSETVTRHSVIPQILEAITSSNIFENIERAKSASSGPIVSRTMTSLGINDTIEGSGLGPPSQDKNQKQKLDDTEDSEDDIDDEDYDYKDSRESGSGHKQVKTTTLKPDMTLRQTETLKRPPNQNFYNPFRPAVTSVGPTLMQLKPEILPGPFSTAPPSAKLFEGVNITSPLPAVTSLPTTVVTNPPSKILASSKAETDYDYEDDNDDDEHEDTSVFEDNDTNDDVASSNKTTTLLTNVLQTTPIFGRFNTTTYDNSTVQRTNNSRTNPVYSKQQEVSKNEVSISSEQKHTSEPMLRPVSKFISRPSNIPVGRVSDDDNEDEDQDSDDDDDDEEEEEDNEDDETGTGMNSSSQNITSNHKPTNNEHLANEHKLINQNQNNFKKQKPQPGPNPTIAPPPQVRESTIAPTKEVASQSNSYGRDNGVSTASNSIMGTPIPERANIVPIEISTVFPVSTSGSILTSTVPSVIPPIKDFGHSIEQAIRPPSLLPHWMTSPVVPVYYQTTTPSQKQQFYTPLTPDRKIKVSPAMTTNVFSHDRYAPAASYNDESLTRQIYDKAVEAYNEADKTIRSAVDAVWPPDFNFDQSALEPLLARPIFFMLALGGAIMGLVLLMMLVVYMITYQIEPKDDDISIY